MSSYFRYRLVGLSLLVGMAAFQAANAQAPISHVGSGAVEDRVTQLERISDARGQLLTQLQQQLSDNQADIDVLRGQIQENQYQLNQIVERQKQILRQLDSSGNGDTAAAPLAEGDKGATEVTQGGGAAADAPQPAGDAGTDYNAAVVLLRDKSRQQEAMKAFEKFIKKYPDSALRPNAGYWLGQLNYNKGKKDNAAYYFASVVKNYPQSAKAPDAMYKVGVIMQDKGDDAKARAVYQQVITKYPDTEGARQAQKRLNALP